MGVVGYEEETRGTNEYSTVWDGMYGGKGGATKKGRKREVLSQSSLILVVRGGSPLHRD